MLKRILQERDQKADNAHSNDAITKSETEIAAPEQQHLGADELRTAMVAILDKSFPVFHDVRQTAETSEIQIAQPYWFRCPTCKFDYLAKAFNYVRLSVVRHGRMPKLPKEACTGLQDRIRLLVDDPDQGIC